MMFEKFEVNRETEEKMQSICFKIEEYFYSIGLESKNVKVLESRAIGKDGKISPVTIPQININIEFYCELSLSAYISINDDPLNHEHWFVEKPTELPGFRNYVTKSFHMIHTGFLKECIEMIKVNLSKQCKHSSTSSWGRLATCLDCGHEWVRESYDD